MANPNDLGLFAEYEFTSASADGSDATVTLAAALSVRHVIRNVGYYYEAIVTGDHFMTIAWTRRGVAKTYTACIFPTGATAQVPIDFPEGYIFGDVNTAITITLTGGAAGNVCYLNVFYR